MCTSPICSLPECLVRVQGPLFMVGTFMGWGWPQSWSGPFDSAPAAWSLKMEVITHFAAGLALGLAVHYAGAAWLDFLEQLGML